MEKDEKYDQNRRNFLKTAGVMIGVTVAAGTIGSALSSCERDETPPGPKPGETADVDLSLYPVLATIGGVAKVTVKNTKYIIKRDSSSAFLVYSAICPHQGCEVDLPTAPNAGAMCPCHAVVFSMTKGENGKVLNNPQGVSTGPLPTLTSSYDAGKNILKISLT